MTDLSILLSQKVLIIFNRFHSYLILTLIQIRSLEVFYIQTRSGTFFIACDAKIKGSFTSDANTGDFTVFGEGKLSSIPDFVNFVWPDKGEGIVDTFNACAEAKKTAFAVADEGDNMDGDKVPFAEDVLIVPGEALILDESPRGVSFFKAGFRDYLIALYKIQDPPAKPSHKESLPFLYHDPFKLRSPDKCVRGIC